MLFTMDCLGKLRSMTSMADGPINEDQLVEWERLEKAATPGPWGYSLMPVAGKLTAKNNHRKRYSLISDDVPFVNSADAELAALSRTVLPHLIAEVRRLRAERTTTKTPIGSFWRDSSEPDNPIVKRWNGESWEDTDAETDGDGNVLVLNIDNRY